MSTFTVHEPPAHATDRIDRAVELAFVRDGVIVKIQQEVVAPVCTPGLPRIMVLLDASSSMLNIGGGFHHAHRDRGGGAATPRPRALRPQASRRGPGTRSPSA